MISQLKQQLRSFFQGVKQSSKTRFDSASTQFANHAHSFPTPIEQFTTHHPKLALLIAIALPLLPVLFVLRGFIFLILVLTLTLIGIAAYYGSLIWLIHRKASSGRSSPVSIFVLVSVGICIPVPFLPHLLLLLHFRNPGHVRRGARLVSALELKRFLIDKQQAIHTQETHYPLLAISDIPIPPYLENLGFFFVGSPGSGKTQAIKQLLATLKDRPDFRVMVLDRNGELLESFFDPHQDVLFNPRDQRSIAWNHRTEGMEPETIAAALVPDDSKDRFFSEAAKSLLADLYDRCDSNAEVWEVISSFSLDELRDFLAGSVSARYFGAENTGSSVLSTLVNEMRFYRRLKDDEGFSFSEWGRSDDPRWLFCSVFEDDAELHKSLFSMAFELMLKGLLSHPDPESRRMKTAIVIDELGALNPLRSLPRLMSESRKFLGTAILGTQTEAQIDQGYGELNRRILLQGSCTKLILNCRDAQTAETMANLIGKQERIDINYSKSRQGGQSFSVGSSATEQIRETHAVMPAELQALPNLVGYLTIADGTPAAQVTLVPQAYPKRADRWIAAVPIPEQELPSKLPQVEIVQPQGASPEFHRRKAPER